jgi:anti-sigma regulatory factor (Ser/Thr protein kinase)
MSHGHPRTVLQEGWHSGQEPPSAGQPHLLTSASVLPAPNWVRRQVVSCQPDLGLAAKAARDYSERVLRGWGLQPLADDAAVIVSELVSNAIRHGVNGRNGSACDCIELILWRRPGQIICAVTDPGVGAPAMANPDPLAEQGRGLHVVEALSVTWGWTRLGGPGKAVWAALAVPGAEGAGRTGRAEPGTAEADHNHAAWQEWRSRSA